jgi:hypothetical protein
VLRHIGKLFNADWVGQNKIIFYVHQAENNIWFNLLGEADEIKSAISPKR